MIKKQIVISMRFYPNKDYKGDIISVDEKNLVAKFVNEYKNEFFLYIPKGMLLFIRDDDNKLIKSPTAKLVDVVNHDADNIIINLEWELLNSNDIDKRNKILELWQK